MIQATAAVPWLIGAGKGLLGMAAKGGASKLAGAAAGMGARQGIKRFAGSKLGGLMGKEGTKQLSLFGDDVVKTGLNMTEGASKLERIKRGLTSAEGFKKNLGIPMTKDDILMTVAPDLLFGGISAATTEGDIVDKALAGAGSAVGGIAGGVGLRGVLGPKSGLGVLGSEMIGGIVGDQVGYGTANALIRAKHGGMTPQEQSMAQGDEAYRQQIIDEFLAQNGLG